MFGGNRAVAGKDVAIDCAVDVVFVTVNFIAEDFGRESIVVQAAVAQMSEADDLYAFEILFQIFGAPADKVGNAPDRNGNIVFDAGLGCVGRRRCFRATPTYGYVLVRFAPIRCR